ncbi:MAG: CPBP family intramembrane glutamic endopeptidase [Anaerolineae bacterium]
MKRTFNSHERKEANGLWAFFILTYALMLLTWGIMAVFQMRAAAATDTGAPPSAFGMVLFLLGGFSPTIAGAIMAWRVQGRDGLRDLWKRSVQFRLGGVWYLAILGLPLLVRGLQAVAFALRGGGFVEPPFVAQPVSLIGFTIMMFLFGPVSEEFGWRGFALDRLLARQNALRAGLILGVLWACWHLLLFFIPGTAQQQMGNPVPMFTGFAVEVVAMSVLFTWLYVNTARSIWGVILFHMALNYTNNLLFMVTGGTVGLATHLTGTVGLVALAVTVAAVYGTNLQRGQHG